MSEFRETAKDSGELRRLEAARRESSGPSWQAIGLFLATFLSVVSLVFEIILALAIVDTREELRQVRALKEAERYAGEQVRINDAIAKDREQRKETGP